YATPLPFPFVLGRDLAGEVAAAGPGAVGFAPGRPVWCNSLGHAGRQGAAAQYAVVAADPLYPAPPGGDEEHLVAAAHPAASAGPTRPGWRSCGTAGGRPGCRCTSGARPATWAVPPWRSPPRREPGSSARRGPRTPPRSAPWVPPRCSTTGSRT